MIKKASLLILIIGYTYAGVNHFRNPASYIRIIPHYIPFPVFVNYMSGVLEICFGLLLVFKRSRSYTALGICLMLIAFLPVHIQMIIDAPFKLGTFAVTPLVAWLRLALQPVLLLWAWWYVAPPNPPRQEGLLKSYSKVSPTGEDLPAGQAGLEGVD